MLTSKQYLALAIPLIISMITTPLLGLVDTIVIGNLDNAYYIGGVAIAVTLFNTLYWLFGFLRASTIGLVSQAAGRDDAVEVHLSFYRPVLIALAIGVLFIALQTFIFDVAMFFIRPEQSIYMFVEQYYEIRIWGAPFALVMYALLGWLVGMKKIKMSLVFQIYMNMLNIILCIAFVVIFKWEVKGVALATLICEVSAPILGLLYLRWGKYVSWQRVFHEKLVDRTILLKIFLMNRDLLAL